MKQPMTRAQIRSINDTTLSISYCGMQHLLINHAPFAYNGGVYGWNWDAYNVYGVTVCTGYRNLTGRTPDYCTVLDYEDRARRIYSDYSMPYQTRCEKIEKLLQELIEKIAA